MGPVNGWNKELRRECKTNRFIARNWFKDAYPFPPHFLEGARPRVLKTPLQGYASQRTGRLIDTIWMGRQNRRQVVPLLESEMEVNETDAIIKAHSFSIQC